MYIYTLGSALSPSRVQNALADIFLLACPYVGLCCGCSPRIAPFLASPVRQRRLCRLRVPAPSCRKGISSSAAGPPPRRGSQSALLAGGCYLAAAIEDVLQIPNCSLWMLKKNGKTQRGIERGARYRHAGAALPWLIVPPWERPGSGLKSARSSERLASF